VVTPGAFAALGIPLKRGRDFNEGDTYDAPFTAIVNEALARKSFPGQDPLGRLIYCGLDSDKIMKIVGVVGDVRQYGPAVEPWPEIVMPYEQHPQTATALNIVVRASVQPAARYGGRSSARCARVRRRFP
jgi:putative ABC transport system permease protein